MRVMRDAVVELIPIPSLPAFRNSEVVNIFDDIRNELSKDDDFAEFYWFAREYPRVFRHHLQYAEHRLKLIHSGYEQAQAEFESHFRNGAGFEYAFSGIEISKIHWEFESYLNCISSALDVLARLAGIGFPQQLPISFNKLCSSSAQGDLICTLRAAKQRWVDRLKNYRDCFVHFTPTDTLLFISCARYEDGWETRMRIPVNPNSRDIILFRYARRTHILSYSLAVYRNLVALDRKIAKQIKLRYKNGIFPERRNNLFFIGVRT